MPIQNSNAITLLHLGSKSLDIVTETASQLGETLINNRTNFDFNQIASYSVQDAVAKSVAKSQDLETETCDMHNGDRVGSSAAGRLVRKYERTNAVNAFAEGQELEKKLNQQANIFRQIALIVRDILISQALKKQNKGTSQRT